MDVAVLMHTGWLVPVLALLVAVDGPFPVVPSEPLLMTASAVAIGSQDVPMTAGLVAAALVGSIAGDHLLFALGRTSRRSSNRRSAASSCGCGATSSGARP
ncbi:hypothetical protein BJF78_11345 [Pseudonocardia sp. CNS-139]|nr:hypothetical protein BJF78_11345 [Pseudonocardia sp. CNS-139]